MSLAGLLFGFARNLRRYTNIIKDAVRKNLKPDVVRREIQRVTGKRFTRAMFNRSYGVIRSAMKFWETKKFYPSQVVTGVYREVVKYLDTKYKTVIELDVYNRQTQTSFKAYVTVSHNRQLRLRQLAQASINALTSFGKSNYLEIYGYRFVEGYKSRRGKTKYEI